MASTVSNIQLGNQNQVGVKLDTAIDANASVSTVGMDLQGNTKVGVYITDVSGAHTTHITTLEISHNNTDWFATTTTITGLGFNQLTEVAARFARATISLVEGGASVIDITLISN